MELEGTVVNGVIVPDGNPPLPEGARVRIRLAGGTDPDAVPPAPAETYAEHLAGLQQSVEDAKAGRGRPLEEVMAEIAKEFDLPPVTPG